MSKFYEICQKINQVICNPIPNQYTKYQDPNLNTFLDTHVHVSRSQG